MLSVIIPTRDLAYHPPLPPGADEILLVGGEDGPAIARNVGARNATGDVLLFLDDDVVVEGDLNWFKYRPAREAWWTATFVDGTGQQRTRRLIAGLNLAARLGMHAASIGPFVGVRRGLFERVGGFPEKAVHEDTSLSRVLGKTGAKLYLAPFHVLVQRVFTTYSGQWDRASRRVGKTPSSNAPVRRLVPSTPTGPGMSGSR